MQSRNSLDVINIPSSILYVGQFFYKVGIRGTAPVFENPYQELLAK
jgi:hypothetical protein